MFTAYQTIHRRFADRHPISLAAPAGRKAVAGEAKVDGRLESVVDGRMDRGGRGGIAPPPSSARRFRAGRSTKIAGFAILLVMMGAALGAGPSGTSRGAAAPHVRFDPVVVSAPREATPHDMGSAGAASDGAALDDDADETAPDSGGPMRIVVNLPAFRLDVLSGHSTVRSFPITIGAHGYETPTGEYTISEIIFNPWWHPPQSEWAIGKSPVAPGPQNPMGRAKLQFDGLLYIHGSSNVAALGDVGSHGCVRLANDDVLELARLVQVYGAPESEVIVEAAVANPGRSVKLDLGRSIALEIRYDVAEVRDGFLLVHPDVYGLRRNRVPADIVAALARVGFDLEELAFVPAEVWAAAAGSGRTVAVPLEEIRGGNGFVAGLGSVLGM